MHLKTNRLPLWVILERFCFGWYSQILGESNWTVCSPAQTIGTQCPNVTGHNCPITEAIWHTHNGPVRQASNMAATQKPQHILGTTAMLYSQGGLGKGGVASLETPPTHHKRSTVTQLSWRRRKCGQTVVGYISLKPREWRSLSKLWEVFNLWYNCLLFEGFFRKALAFWGKSQEWLTKLWPKICSLFFLPNLSFFPLFPP